MLKIKIWSSTAPDNCNVIAEGCYHQNGGLYTKEVLECVAGLPRDYGVGTVTKDRYGFVFEVVSV